jgi:hypothetical protein
MKVLSRGHSWNLRSSRTDPVMLKKSTNVTSRPESGCNVLCFLFAASHNKQKINIADDPEPIQHEEEEAIWILADEY